jgi:hypothetical protein
VSACVTSLQDRKSVLGLSGSHLCNTAQAHTGDGGGPATPCAGRTVQIAATNARWGQGQHLHQRGAPCGQDSATAAAMGAQSGAGVMAAHRRGHGGLCGAVALRRAHEHERDAEVRF